MSGERRKLAQQPPRWIGPPRRVLLIDDDDLMLRAVTRVLRSAGLTVESTTDPDELLTLVRSSEPHAIISDLHMPGSCGAALLAKSVELAPDAMRVLLSADPDYRPKVGTLADARLHALMSKGNIAGLVAVVIAQLRGRTEVPENRDEREELALSVARALARPGHEDDSHRDRLTRWTSTVATAMGLPPEEIAQARLGAILHDVGHVTLRDAVIAHSGVFTEGDREELTTHPDAGARIVADMPALRDALPVITAHHERQDGRGYPAQLDGTEIPRPVLAFQVADAYDAMTKGRDYSARRTHRAAVEELSLQAGKHHGVDAVRALAAIGEDGLAAALEG